MSFQSPSSALFFSKNDPKDIRLGDRVRSLESSEIGTNTSVSIVGYPDDEGIQLNGGRLGAAQAPTLIRKAFYKMTPHPLYHHSFEIIDRGDLVPQMPLENRHQTGRELIRQLTARNEKWITLGGGHDYGFADGAGFLDSVIKSSSSKPLIFNFDAHLDVRPNTKGPNSGTPFYRLLTEFNNQFDLVEVGLQPQCNSPHHWRWAMDQGATLIPIDTIQKRGLMELFTESYEPDQKRPIFISLDMDVFSSSEAPGCSQSWAQGLHVREFLPVLTYLIESYDVKGLGIYEVSPPLDQDDRTSKLAALIAHHFLFQSLLTSSKTV